MPVRFRAARLMAVALAACSPLLMGASSLSSGFETRILAAHNRERASLDIAPLHWNAELAADAQKWANHLAATGAFKHAPERIDEPQGENLWAGTRNAFVVESRVGAWIREKSHFKQGVFPHNSTTGDVEDVGHYTQLIWRDTHKVGCAQATGTREDFLVCRYSSAGNYIGERVY
jgi:uncharacterized protein YkwD